MKQCIIFLGKTGSGKDTQANLLVQKYHVDIIRLGDLVRAKAKTDAAIASSLRHGELVKDSVVDSLLSEQIDTLSPDAIFVSDGYPRHIEQAHTLEDYLTSAKAQLAAVVHFTLPDSVVRLRLQLRAREDDAPDVVLERLKEFQEFTQPVVDYFSTQYKDRFIEVDATPAPEEIFMKLEQKLTSIVHLDKR